MELNVKPRLYNGKKTGEFLQALPQKLTINKKLLSGGLKIFTSEVSTDETCFEEVKRVPFELNEEVKQLELEISRQKPLKGDWVKDLYEANKDYIFKTWDSKKFHIVAHSSGYDSRILSQALFDLYKKHGKEWLGVTLFVENHGEGELTRKILKLEGWEDKYFFHYGKNVPPQALHGSSFQWDSYFNKFNGIGSYPVNQWYDAYNKMYQMGVIPKDCQYYTGYGANEVLEMFAKHKRPISGYLSWHHTLQLGIFKDWGDAYHPFWDSEWIKRVYAYDLRDLKSRINQIVTMTISPNLRSVPRWDITETTKAGYKHVDFDLMNNLIELYRNSFFGQRVRCKANNWLEYLDWWGHVCIASLCDYLLKRGFKIEYE
jgi:hypothetical protein